MVEDEQNITKDVSTVGLLAPMLFLSFSTHHTIPYHENMDKHRPPFLLMLVLLAYVPKLVK